MITTQDVQFIQEPLSQAKTIVIAMGVNANYDVVASALSLYLSLKNSGKSVYIVCSAPMRVEFSYLVGVDEVREKLGNKSLMISFDYDENAVEKVSYSISEDGKKFQLLVSPKTGHTPLDPSTVQYAGSGAEADLLFVFGAASYEDLGLIYETEKYFFESVFSVSLNAFEGQQFTRVALDSSGQTCLAEGVGVLLGAMGMQPVDDIATNILSSIEQATNRFQSFGMNPETFEMVAQLMRNGARRSSIHQFAQDGGMSGTAVGASNVGGVVGGGTPPVYSAHTAQGGQTYVSNLPPMYGGQTTQPSTFAQNAQTVPMPQPIPQTLSVPPATPVSTSSFAQALRAKQSGKNVVGGVAESAVISREQVAQTVQYMQTPQPQQPQQAQQPQIPSQQIFQIQHGNGVIQQPIQTISPQQVAASEQAVVQHQTTQPPQEWMQPKVFTGATRV